ncbi:MAG: hypothetical protein WC297_01650 [Candidatus Paceibacterota bacterium]|jgi:hypothetical protein
MEYPRTLIEEQLQRPEELEVGWPWRLLVLTIFIFGLMVVIVLGIKFGYEPYLNKKTQTLDAQITSLNQSLNQGQVDEFIKFYSQIADINILTKKHIFGSNALKFLEETSLKTLTYTSLSLDSARKELKLSGVVPTYEALAQQLEIFRQNELVENVSFKNSSKSDQGGINFDAVLTMQDSLFREAPASLSVSAPDSVSISTPTSTIPNSTSTQQ